MSRCRTDQLDTLTDSGRGGLLDQLFEGAVFEYQFVVGFVEGLSVSQFADVVVAEGVVPGLEVCGERVRVIEVDKVCEIGEGCGVAAEELLDFRLAVLQGVSPLLERRQVAVGVERCNVDVIFKRVGGRITVRDTDAPRAAAGGRIACAPCCAQAGSSVATCWRPLGSLARASGSTSAVEIAR